MPTLLIVVLAAAVVLAIVLAVVWYRRRAVPPPRTASVETAAPGVVARPAGLAARLSRSRAALGGRLSTLLRRGLDDAFWDDLEDTLVAADLGVATASEVVADLRASQPEDAVAARAALRDRLVALFAGQERAVATGGSPSVVVVVGVNGSGKTTSIAKLAARLGEDGSTTLLGAADTFRAAADQQLRTWAERVGVEVVGGQPGADPAAVAFDAYQAARARGRDVVIIDTAGRLHSKKNLMEELGKVVRVLRREAGDLDEVLLVLDGTTGQNAIAQAQVFTEVVGVTGIVLTKLDGTAKGGVAVAVERELGVPVKFIGIGEGVDDLIPFHPDEFVDALLAEG